MKKNLILTIMSLCLLITNVDAQKVTKDLRESSNGYKCYELYDAVNKRCGASDRNGKIIIPMGKYDGLEFHSCEKTSGYFEVQKKIGDKYYLGVCDAFGKEIVPCRYIDIYYDEDKAQFYCNYVIAPVKLTRQGRGIVSSNDFLKEKSPIRIYDYNYTGLTTSDYKVVNKRLFIKILPNGAITYNYNGGGYQFIFNKVEYDDGELKDEFDALGAGILFGDSYEARQSIKFLQGEDHIIIYDNGQICFHIKGFNIISTGSGTKSQFQKDFTNIKNDLVKHKFL